MSRPVNSHYVVTVNDTCRVLIRATEQGANTGKGYTDNGMKWCGVVASKVGDQRLDRPKRVNLVSVLIADKPIACTVW